MNKDFKQAMMDYHGLQIRMPLPRIPKIILTENQKMEEARASHQPPEKGRMSTYNREFARVKFKEKAELEREEKRKEQKKRMEEEKKTKEEHKLGKLLEKKKMNRRGKGMDP